MFYKVIDKRSCLFGYVGEVYKVVGDFIWLKFYKMHMPYRYNINQLEMTRGGIK